MQKNLCPFFFFDGLSPLSLSSSESSASSLASIISVSCSSSKDLVDKCELSRFSTSGMSILLSDLVCDCGCKGEEGNGR